MAARFGLVFTVDGELRKIYRELGIDLPRFNGDDSWTLPIPARFIVDSNRVIRWANADPDYTHRPEPSETIRELRALAIKGM